MLRKTLAAVVLAVSLSLGVKADPILWQQVERSSSQQPTLVNSSQEPASPAATGQVGQSSADDGVIPKFVRLPDGRIVPYGAGVICTENCVEGETFEQRTVRRPGIWYVTIPAVVGGIIVTVLATRGHDSLNPNRGNPKLFDIPSGTDRKSVV